MLISTITFAYITIISSWIIAFVLIFGVILEDSPNERFPGIQLRLVRWTRAQRALLDRILAQVLGHRIHSRLQSLGLYCSSQRNPILPILYIVIMQIILIASVLFCLPFMDSIPKIWFVCLYTACMYTFTRCWKSSPGVINKFNHAACMEYYQYDHTMFQPGSLCRTCHIEKVARSKHCRYCNVCVARFDHHCVWVNNCIGANNIGRFISFLLIKSISCVYMIILVGYIIMEIIDEKGLLTRRLITATGQVIPNSWLNITRYLIGHHSQLVVLFLFMVPTTVFISGFTLYHIKLLLSNTTTNESLKLEHMKKGTSSFYFDAYGKDVYSNVRETLTAKFSVK